MATTIDLPALALAALADIEANAPRPPAPAMTNEQVESLLAALQADIPTFAAKVQAYPGLITAAIRILTALADQGETWATTLKAVIDALPGGLAMAQQYLPTVIGLLTAFSPAPPASPIGGDPNFSRAR